MKKTFLPMAMTLTLLATSCANDDIFNLSDADKNMISFSLSDGSRESRAGFTTAATRIVARFQSEAVGKSSLYTRTYLEAAVDGTNNAESFSTVDYVSGNKRYWDDAYGRAAKISVYAVAIPNSTDKTKLTDEILAGDGTWKSEATPNNNIVWSVTNTTQTSTTLAGEDLAYSNNIKEGGKNGRYVWDYTANKYPDNNGRLDGHTDGQLKFTQKDGAQASDAGHFDKGHLMFNHALSRLTIHLEEGEDYNNTAGDFKFTNNGENIKLLSVPTAGTLDVKAGTWTVSATTDVNVINGAVGPAAAAGTFQAQVLPSYKFYGDGANASANVMQFVIDNNTYFITQKMVYDALNVAANTEGTNPKVTVETDASSNHYIEMKQGKNYDLSITVKKTKIDNITATLADWVNVEGSMSVNNAHITLNLKTMGSVCDKDIDLYRLDEDNNGYDADNYDFSYDGTAWFGNYTTDTKHKTTLLHSALSDSKWTTPWYFESNKTYYHFRTVNNGTTVQGNTDATNDYFEIAAGPVANTDPHWGAPMKSTTTTWLKYDDNNTLTNYDDDKGYEAHLHHAIGATESQVAIQELHMMSNIKVILKTPDNGGKVMLKDGEGHETVVKITRIAANGTVEMGRGVVKPTDEYTGELTMTNPTTYFATDGLITNEYSYAVVPQSLSRNFSSTDDTDYIGIFIQTPDHNQYYVVKKLSEIKATSVSDQRNQTLNDYIKRWYPGHTYTYTFTITKTGIENITCTVADWVTVTGENTNLDLED